MLIILKDIYKLLRTGKTVKEHWSINTTIKKILVIYLISIVISVLTGVFIVASSGFLNITIPKAEISNYLLRGKLSAFIIICLIAPVIEELLHRLILVISNINLAIMLTILSYIIACKLTNTEKYTIDNYFLFKVGFSTVIGILILICLNILPPKKIIIIWSKYSNIVFYVSITLFVFPHILNYNLKYKDFFILPLLMLPQLTSGILLGYIRLKLNIRYSMLLHIIINLTAFVPFLFD